MKHTKTCRVCDVILVAGSKATNPKGNCYPSNMELGKRICNSCTKAYIREKSRYVDIDEIEDFNIVKKLVGLRE